MKTRRQKCPHCGGTLRVAYSEHTDYEVKRVHDGYVARDDKTASTYDTNFIHIACDKCNRYWYSIEDFQRDVKHAAKK